MNVCPECGKPLVTKEQLHAVDGSLYCSRRCAVRTLADTFFENAIDYRTAVESANKFYDDNAEVICMEDVLGEDLQEVQVSVTFFKTIKVPKCLSRKKAIEVAEKMLSDGKLLVEPGHCDDVTFECALVSDNSSCDT